MDLSVILPVYNEASLLLELHRRLSGALAALDLDFELIFVDDGSTDGSAEELEHLAQGDRRLKLVLLSRNFGHQVALSAGLDYASGDAAVIMDSDLQDPPELVPELVARWKQGAEVVTARRRARPGESWFKRSTAFAFYRLFARITSVPIQPDTGDFCLLARPALDALRRCRERRRFVRALLAWCGFRRVSVEYDRPQRPRGETKYGVGRMVRLALQATFAFSDLPVKALGLAGGCVCIGSLAALAAGAAPASAGLFLLAGTQLLGLWVLGQHLSAVAEEARARPLYITRRTVNLEAPPSAAPR
jgi:dolichol-phosphate mannosyltransferase